MVVMWDVSCALFLPPLWLASAHNTEKVVLSLAGGLSKKGANIYYILGTSCGNRIKQNTTERKRTFAIMSNSKKHNHFYAVALFTAVFVCLIVCCMLCIDFALGN